MRWLIDRISRVLHRPKAESRDRMLAQAAEHFDAMFDRIEAQNPPSPARDLVKAAFKGDLARVKELLAAGVAIDVRDGHSNTPLHAAIENHQPHIVEFLLQQGADPNDEPQPGWTPLCHAIDIEGDTASQLDYVDPPTSILTAMLLRHGADPLRRGVDGKLPAEVAEQYLHHDAVRLLASAIAGDSKGSGDSKGPGMYS